MNPTIINDLIRKRRAIFPATYIDQEIPLSILHEILENATWAPTHRFTEPWRFKVFRGSSLEKLSMFLGETYKKHSPEGQFSAVKYKKIQKKPLQSACVIAICMQRDPQKRIPEWEEIAAVSCAVQNMWLTCTAYDIGCYWSSPSLIKHTAEFLELSEGESCLGFFYMGYYQMPEITSKRSPIEDKVVFF